MAEETTTAPAPNEEMEAKKKQILQLTCKVHERTWLLHEICLLTNQEIKTAMGRSNVGAIGNVIKDYNEHPEKITKAKELLK